MNKVKVTPRQLARIKEITDAWDGHVRWPAALGRYLWDYDIRPSEDANPAWPDSYKFLAGGIDHIDETETSITIHDRCMETSGGTILDGTTRFHT